MPAVPTLYSPFARSVLDIRLSYSAVHEIVAGMGGLSPISAIEDNILMALIEEFRTGGKVTMAVIEGRAGGGGAEFTYVGWEGCNCLVSD